MSRKSQNCLYCNKPIYPNQSCSCKDCLIQHHRKELLINWLKTGIIPYTIATTIRGIIREFILESQFHRCAICGNYDIWNKQPLKFVLDHINGDASNNHRDNLRLICPNCDSQLSTYKSKNKQSARTYRK